MSAGGWSSARRSASGTLLAGLLATLAVTPSAGAFEGRLTGLVDLRLFTTDAGRPWLDGGLDKLRHGDDDEPLALGAALLDAGARFGPTLSAHGTLAVYDGTDELVDLTEAYLEWRPVPRSAWRWRVRGGAFYPPLSLENGDTAWTSPYTLAFSAINTWIGEEIRTVGAEAEATLLGRLRGAADDFGVVGGVFGWNDPAGALISWRGWALHDRQTGLFERLPLADLPGFRDDGSFPPQEAFEEPFVELDERAGLYGGVSWNRGDRWRVRALRYDNRADPTIVEGGQWSWRTRFDHLGLQVQPRRGLDLILQALAGDTLMVGFTGPLVDAEYQAAFVLASQSWHAGAHRASVRLDVFGVSDEDPIADDANQEHGRAVTVSYFFTQAPWRIGAELLRVESDRPARRSLATASRGSETVAQLALQWRF